MPYVKQERRKLLDECVNNASKIKARMMLWVDDLLVYMSGKSEVFVFMDNSIIPLAKYMRKNVKPNGDINYFLFKFAKYHIKPSYNNYKNYMGAIYEAIERTIDRKYKNEYREAAEWVRIKLLTPYEENKLIENGDL